MNWSLRHHHHHHHHHHRHHKYNLKPHPPSLKLHPLKHKTIQMMTLFYSNQSPPRHHPALQWKLQPPHLPVRGLLRGEEARESTVWENRQAKKRRSQGQNAFSLSFHAFFSCVCVLVELRRRLDRKDKREKKHNFRCELLYTSIHPSLSLSLSLSLSVCVCVCVCV